MKRRILSGIAVALVALVVPAHADMITVANSATTPRIGIGGAPAPTTGTLSNFEVFDAAHRMLIVAVVGENVSGTPTAMFGTTAMTLSRYTAAGNTFTAIYTLTDPVAATADITVNKNASGSGLVISAVSLTSPYAMQIAAANGAGDATGTNTVSFPLSGIAAGDFIIGAVGFNNDPTVTEPFAPPFGTSLHHSSTMDQGGWAADIGYAILPVDWPSDTYQVTWVAGSSNRNAGSAIAVHAVPEPATLGLLAGVLATLGGFTLRRRWR